MGRTRLIGMAAVLVIAGLAANGLADVVVLTLNVDQLTSTWQVHAYLEGDEGGDPTSAGLSGFGFSVVGGGGIVVDSSLNESPQLVYVPLALGIAGFYEARQDHNGTPGQWITGSQPTVYSGGNTPANDAKVLQGVGIDAGTYDSGIFGSVSWGDPVLLASGTFTGSDGTIEVQPLDPGDPVRGFLVLKDVVPGDYGWRGPGNNSAPSDLSLPAPWSDGGEELSVSADWIEIGNGSGCVDVTSESVELVAVAAGGALPYDYAWDLDLDGFYDDFFGPNLVLTGADIMTILGNPVLPPDCSYIWMPAVQVTDGLGATASDHVEIPLVPEPATMGLLVLGGLGLIARRRRHA